MALQGNIKVKVLLRSAELVFFRDGCCVAMTGDIKEMKNSMAWFLVVQYFLKKLVDKTTKTTIMVLVLWFRLCRQNIMMMQKVMQIF